ncbi:MAG: hypothetical protein WBG86_10085 [Polyangiales bacterium]
MSSAAGLFFALALLSTIAFVPTGARGDGFKRGRYQGTFEYVGTSPQARRTIDRAIEEVTDEMGFLKDGIAQDRLEDKLTTLPTITIEFEGTMVAVTLRGSTYQSRIGGGWAPATNPDGDEVQIRHRIKNGKLVEEIRTDKGRRINVFAAKSDTRLVVTTIVTSPKLPSDIRYALMYQRKK